MICKTLALETSDFEIENCTKCYFYNKVNDKQVYNINKQKEENHENSKRV